MAVNLAHKHSSDVIKEIDRFDPKSGSFTERLIFNNRLIIVLLCALLTCFFAFEAIGLRLNANFEGTIPTKDPFMVNYYQHFEKLQSKGNALRIVVEADHGTIANPKYLATLEAVTQSVLDLPGIDRPFTTSLWTSTTRWIGVNQYGITGGAVIDDQYDGSPAEVAAVMQNIVKTGRIGDLVGTDLRSSMIYAPLMNHNGLTGEPINYGQLGRQLLNLRAQYAKQGVTLHVIGFPMIVGFMILGIYKILLFFLISILVAAAFLLWFTRCPRSTFLVVLCTLVAVDWQMGLLSLFGYDLDPYSVLVPFLIFAIGMSHGAQKMNGVMQDIGRGIHPQIAARYTFRRLFLTGLTALICDAVGFGVLSLIPINEIRELAIVASAGVAILIFTNLILLPVLLSYFGVSRTAAIRSLRAEAIEELDTTRSTWGFLSRFTTRRFAIPTLAAVLCLGVIGFVIGRHAQIGNVTEGAPELRYTSTYNADNRYIESHYGVSNDSLVLLVDSAPYECTDFRELNALYRIGWRLRQMPEVQSTSSIALVMTMITQIMNDDSPKWNQLVDNQALINDLEPFVPPDYASLDCSFVPFNISLYNLKARTLQLVVSEAETLIAENKSPTYSIELAAGDGGIAAATDRVIARANTYILIWIYTAVAALCFVAFRSLRAVICAILPLLLTSLLCQALMVLMGIGITVATLPVVALGVGIGVDYSLYVLGIMMTHLRNGVPLRQAYLRALRFTGRIVMFTGFTLAIGVGTWAFAPIKFQADMGLLLAFMFLLNMFGSLIVMPALAYVLLKRAAGPNNPMAAYGTASGRLIEETAEIKA